MLYQHNHGKSGLKTGALRWPRKHSKMSFHTCQAKINVWNNPSCSFVYLSRSHFSVYIFPLYRECCSDLHWKVDYFTGHSETTLTFYSCINYKRVKVNTLGFCLFKLDPHQIQIPKKFRWASHVFLIQYYLLFTHFHRIRAFLLMSQRSASMLISLNVFFGEIRFRSCCALTQTCYAYTLMLPVRVS